MKKIKTNKKNLIILLTFATLVSLISLPLTPNTNSVDFRSTELDPKSSQFIPRTIRVAIYNEPNTTMPSYGTGTLYHNLTDTIAILTNAGYQVTNITTQEIYDHKLKTADYDVFVMVDNLPKTNISNYVKEYWLGGGGLLSFDSAINFLCYAGILPPESEGDNGRSTYWEYIGGIHTIYQRHPISKSYSSGDLFTSLSTRAGFDWAVLQTTSIASDLVRIATIDGSPNDVTVLGFDPSNGGGRVVQLPWPNGKISSNMADLVSDAVDWLCPRPKGRILFDLSHIPYYGIDSWDDVASSANYGIWRDTLVSRGYTVDKLIPSVTGNLTASNLLPYDMLFLCMPDINFTSNEVTAVTQWVNNGGGLLVIGEHSGFADKNNNINYLLGSYDLQMVSVDGTSGATYNFEHPTIEGCISIDSLGPGTINYTGEAYPIWGYDDTEISVAGQEYGNGRIILMSDVAPFRDTNINTLHNIQYAINVANWLTSGNAEVLVYVDEPTSPNYYRTPVTNALNELGINFYLTYTDEYLNLSLNLFNWELVVIDNPISAIVPSVLTEVDNFVKGGGRLIMSSYRVNYYITHPLWASLGFAYDQDQPDTSSLYIWDTAHPIFNTLINYGAARFDPIYDYGNEGDLLMIYPNATALAGYTASETVNNANLVLSNNGNTLYNGYLIDQFTGDLDNSTYADNIELWINEITFMLRPGLFSLSSDADSPDDDGVFDLSWTVSDDATEYNIYQPTSLITKLTGAETLIAGGVTANSHPLTGLTNGTYYFIVESTNDFGNIISNCIEITIEIPPTPPDPDPDPDPSPGGIPGYEFITLISTILIITSVLTLVLSKRNRLRK